MNLCYSSSDSNCPLYFLDRLKVCIRILPRWQYLITMLFLLLAGLQLAAQSTREQGRQDYEKKIILQIQRLDFDEIPWMEIFRDSKLRPSEVKRVFEQKYAHAQKEEKRNVKAEGEEEDGLLNKYHIYLQFSGNVETPDHKFIWQDEVLKGIDEYKQARAGRTTAAADFKYIGQTNSVFNTNNGRIERVNFHPTNTNIIWASAPEGGLWKSTDGGVNWAVINDFWAHQSVGDLVYDPNNINRLYLATDDPDSWFNFNRGVLRSDDGGTTWNVVGLPDTMAKQVFKLAISPSGNALYACTDEGLFKSTDLGVTWIKNTSLPATAKANDIEFQPTNPQVIYVTTRSGTDQHPIGGPNYTYFYVSTNGGTTFAQMTLPLDSKGRPAQVSVTPNNPDIAYISVYPDPEWAGPRNQGGLIMKYTHSTQTIITVVDPTFNFPPSNSILSGAWDFRFEIDPQNQNHIIYGCLSVYQSFDGGTTWQYIPSPHPDQHDFKWQSGTNKLWFADDGGLSYSTDTGATWTAMKKLAVTQLYSIRSSKFGTNFLGGVQDAGPQVNMGGYWFQPYGGDGLEVAVDPVDSFTVYAAIQNGGDFKRINFNPVTNNYTSKLIMNQTIAGGFDATWRLKIIIDAADRNTIYTNYRDIFKSTNKGDSWINLTNGSLGNGTTPIEFMYQAKSDPNVIVVGWGNVMKRTTDAGITWNTITFPSGGYLSGTYTTLAFHPNDANIMWVTGNSAVYKTTNGGTSWTTVPGTLPANMVINSIFYQEGTPNGFYISSRFGNVWYRDDNTGDYVLFANNLPHVWVTEVEVLPHAGKVRVATWGRGVWESPLYTSSVNLCIKPAPPVINFSVCATSSVLSIPAAPSGYTIRWEKTGVLLSGQTGTIYTATTNGVYRARYMDNAGSCHSYYSDPANVTFHTQPALLNGNGLHFDGVDDYLTASSAVNLANKSFTISLWAKRQNLNSYQTLLSIGSNAGTNQRIGLRFTNDNKFVCGFENNNLISASSFTDVNWHHWSFVYDRNIIAPANNRFIYVDGVLVASDRTASDYLGDGELRIGVFDVTIGQYFSGTMDDIKIWDQPKTLAQIRQDMFCTPSCYASDMKLYLPFTDGTAGGNNSGLTQITDYSNYNNSQTLVNFAKTGTSSNIVTGVNQFNAYADNDNDGFGAGAQLTTCPTGNWVSNNYDCNDNNPAINPAIIEICGNGIDDNCNGIVDESTLSLGFDGVDDQVTCNNTAGNFSTGNFTIEMRIKTTATSKALISKRPTCDASNSFWNLKVNSTGHLEVEMNEPGQVNYVSDASNTTINDNNWHHIAVVREGTALKIYIDGVPDFTATVPLTNLTNTANLILGNYICTGYFSGQMDEVRIWNIARTSTDINIFKNASLTGNESGLQVYYDFNHATATGGGTNTGKTDLKDRTGNHVDGTLVNFALTGTTSNWLSNPGAVNNTASAASSTPTLCVNTALTNITHTTTNASGIGNATGLPTGATAAWANNTITISGIPTAAGTFNYSIPLAGGCSIPAYATGTITINPSSTAGAASATPTLCINTLLSNITHSTTIATGIGTPVGLPSGVTAAWASNTITISGTPAVSGVFNYTIPLTGGCVTANATGSITVNPSNAAGAASATPTLCINTPLPNITHSTTGATGIGIPAGLPAGITAAWAGNTITISGTPTVSGIYNYNIPLTGVCGTGVNATGTITVSLAPVQKSLNFDGIDDFVSLNSTTVGNFGTGDFSIEFWVNKAAAVNMPVISKRTICNFEVFWNVILNSSNQVEFEEGSPYNNLITASSITLNTWNHIVAVRQGSNKYIYINGALAASNTTAPISNHSTNTTEIMFGKNACSGSANWFKGNLDEVRIWTKALTLSEIQSNKDCEISAPAANLIGYYKLNQNPVSCNAAGSTVLTDYSGNNNNGTLNNFALTGNTSNWVTGTGLTENTVGAASSTPTTCIGVAITNITHSTTMATGISTPTGLPSGVTAAWASNIITISGTPSVTGTFNYSIQLTGGCGTTSATGTITVTEPIIATSNIAQTLNVAGTTLFHSSCINLITKLQPTGGSPVSGNTTSKVWIENTSPAQYVKRHYEITPATGAITATGRVTLYFTQAEFDAFNAVNPVHLPTGSGDASGKANLLVEKRSGVSANGSGSPQSYCGNIVTIDPVDTDIVWNVIQGRWEITFDVTGFSGFFIKTISTVLAGNVFEWTGAISVNWNNPGNWMCNTVPNVTSNVIIKSGVPNYPQVNVNAEVKSVIVQPGATLTVLSGFVLKTN